MQAWEGHRTASPTPPAAVAGTQNTHWGLGSKQVNRKPIGSKLLKGLRYSPNPFSSTVKIRQDICMNTWGRVVRKITGKETHHIGKVWKRVHRVSNRSVLRGLKYANTIMSTWVAFTSSPLDSRVLGPVKLCLGGNGFCSDGAAGVRHSRGNKREHANDKRDEKQALDC